MITEGQTVSWELGRQMLGRTIKCSEKHPDYLSMPRPPTCLCPMPLPHALSLNNFAALSMRHLVAYLLSCPFISYHFSGASQVAAAKRNGRWLQVTDTQQPSGHWQHPGPWLAGTMDKTFCVCIVKG